MNIWNNDRLNEKKIDIDNESNQLESDLSSLMSLKINNILGIPFLSAIPIWRVSLFLHKTAVSVCVTFFYRNTTHIRSHFVVWYFRNFQIYCVRNHLLLMSPVAETKQSRCKVGRPYVGHCYVRRGSSKTKEI